MSTVVWGLLRRRPGAPAGPIDWLGSDDLEWTDNLEDAELVAAATNWYAVVHAERRYRMWVKLPIGIEFREIPGEPKPCSAAEALALWALGRIPGPPALPVEQVPSLMAYVEQPF